VGTLLLTGGAGGVGRRLVAVLQRRGWRVRCLVHEHPVASADEDAMGSLDDEPSVASAVA
jgi:nucleoside-diphosphate-sugar epimerase